MKPLTIFVLLTCAYALWLRRSTYGSRWDGAVTLGLAFQGLNLIAQLPAVSRTIGPILHSVTGVWNVEELAGHILYLAGLMCILYMCLSRLNFPDRERRRMLRTRIELPAVFLIAVLVLLFVWSVPTHDVGDMTAEVCVPAMRPYWAVLGFATLYLTLNSLWALRILSRSPVCKPTSRVYMGACAISLGCCLAGVVDMLHPIPAVMWAFVRMDLLGYAGAGIYSWNHRRFHFKTLKLPTPR